MKLLIYVYRTGPDAEWITKRLSSMCDPEEELGHFYEWRGPFSTEAMAKLSLEIPVDD